MDKIVMGFERERYQSIIYIQYTYMELYISINMDADIYDCKQWNKFHVIEKIIIVDVEYLYLEKKFQ